MVATGADNFQLASMFPECSNSRNQEMEMEMAKFLALYMGAADGSRAAQPSPEAIQKGLAAWHKWGSDHAAQTVEGGGPLGKTKKVSKAGVADTSNAIAGYVIVEAPSQEAAAKMFLNHPHFTIFPGDSVEVMEVMPIPGT
jgi:hypothetical protein